MAGDLRLHSSSRKCTAVDSVAQSNRSSVRGSFPPRFLGGFPFFLFIFAARVWKLNYRQARDVFLASELKRELERARARRES